MCRHSPLLHSLRGLPTGANLGFVCFRAAGDPFWDAIRWLGCLRRAFRVRYDEPAAILGPAACDSRVQVDHLQRFATRTFFMGRTTVVLRVIARMQAASTVKAKLDS